MLVSAEAGGRLTARCTRWSDAGVTEPASATFHITPSDGVTEGADGWAFATPGSYTVTCADGDLEDAVEIAVVGDVASPGAAAVSSGLSNLQGALVNILLADGGADADLVAAYEALLAAPATLPDPLPSPTRTLDEAFWPDTDALISAGVPRVADDDALGAAIADVGAAINDVRAALAAVEPAAATDDTLAQLEALDDTLEAKGAALAALSPSIHGWRDHEADLQAAVLDPLVALSVESGAWTAAHLEVEAGEVLPPFGLVGLVTSMGARSSLRVQLANRMYGDAFAAIDASINNLVAMELISLALPPTGTLSMDYIMASASAGIALPGYNTAIYGSGFSETAGLNQFFILGVDWQGTVDTFLGGCGLGSGTRLERLEAAQACLDEVDSFGEDLYFGATGVFDDGILGDQRVELGPFPAVCGGGFLPVTIGIMAMNLETGSRTAFTAITCLP